MTPSEQDQQIAQTFALFTVADAVKEMRGLKVGRYSNTAAGYFDTDHKDAFVDAVQRCAAALPRGIYTTLNPVHPDLLARYANRLELRAEATTQDSDILRRRWILIDADAKRPSGISADDTQHDAAISKATEVRAFLRDQHGITSVLADSGNGGHVLIPCDLPNDEEAQALVCGVLAGLAQRFDDGSVKIDRSVFNAARISKVYGTLARKGDNVPDKPHRFARLLEVPAFLPPVSPEILRGLCGEASPVPVSPASPAFKTTSAARSGNEPAPFDVPAYLSLHGLTVHKENDRAGWHHWILEQCPFNPEHRHPDAMIAQNGAGALKFKCLHDSCRERSWQDVRKLFEPGWAPYEERPVGPRGLSSRRSASTATSSPEFTVTSPQNSVEIDQRALDAELSGFAHTETGNAERFIARNGRNLRYCAPAKEWLIWDGRCWKPDRMGKIRNLIFETVREIHHEVAMLADKEKRDALSKWALKSEAHRHYAAVESIATFMDGIPISPDDLDTELTILPVKNGVIDLETGRLLPHDRKYLNTRCVEIDYDAAAKCPHWEEYVEWAMCGDLEMVGYIQRIMGYTLSGLTTERAFFFLYGLGGNGKSTITEMMETLMGGESQYFAKLEAASLMESKKNGGGPSEDITKLRWKRFVSVAEMPANARLNEALIKDFTGARDTITGRAMYERHSLSYRPHFSIWWYGNGKPVIKGTDRGIWSRFRLIEFNAQILKEDPEVPKRCLAEVVGVLGWAVKGCLEWRKNGMQTPKKVTEATDEFRQSEDTIGQFIGDMCNTGPDCAEVPIQLYQAYQTWCIGQHTPVSNTAFGRALDSRGYKSKAGNKGRRRIGLQLKAENEENHDGFDQSRRVYAENEETPPSNPHVLGGSTKTRQTRRDDTKPVVTEENRVPTGLEAFATMVAEAQQNAIPVKTVRIGTGDVTNLNNYVRGQVRAYDAAIRIEDEEGAESIVTELRLCLVEWQQIREGA